MLVNEGFLVIEEKQMNFTLAWGDSAPTTSLCIQGKRFPEGKAEFFIEKGGVDEAF
jgi:hypothetical protein